MSEVKKAEKTGVLAKLKKVKNIEVILALVLACAVLLVFFSNLSANGGGSTKKNSSEEYSFSAYVNDLENKIKQVVGNIDGVGKVDLMISFAGGIEEVYAYTTEIKTVNGTDVETRSLSLVGGKPVLLKEIMPQISGIVVVADGGANVAVKLEIIRAIRALLDVKNLTIEVFKRS